MNALNKKTVEDLDVARKFLYAAISTYRSATAKSQATKE